MRRLIYRLNVRNRAVDLFFFAIHCRSFLLRAMKITVLSALLLSGFPGQVFSSPAWQFGSSLRSLNIYSEESPEKFYPAFKFTNNILRLDTTMQSTSRWQFNLSGELQLLGNHPRDFLSFSDNRSNRALDIDKEWTVDEGWDARLQPDRLNVKWNGRNTALSVGRQAVGFGRIVLFSPLDVIAPFAPDALDTDYRPGVDALRFSTFFRQDGQLEAMAVFGESTASNSYLLTWADNFHGVDLLAIGGLLRERSLLGTGFAGNLGPLGLKAELAHYREGEAGGFGGDLYESMTISAVELWYRFDVGLTLISEYLHNGAGAKDPSSYIDSVLSAPYVEGLAPFPGRDYLLFSGLYQLHPLVELNGLLIWNLRDDSWMLRPMFDISLADNTSLSVFATLTYGENTDHNTGRGSTSEFGSQGVSGGLFLRHYFN